jgi:hypothetical protein
MAALPDACAAFFAASFDQGPPRRGRSIARILRSIISITHHFLFGSFVLFAQIGHLPVDRVHLRTPAPDGLGTAPALLGSRYRVFGVFALV